MSEIIIPATEVDPDEVVPDYSRVGFKDLQKLCKARSIPGDGNAAALVDKLKQWDLVNGRTVDLSALDDSDPDFDPLADEPAAPEQPAGGGEAASAPSPTGPAPFTDLPMVKDPEVPAVAVRADPEEPKPKRGQPNLSTRSGLVTLGEGSRGPSRAFRMEFPLGSHELSDVDHFRFIADTHGYAQAAGYTTRGGSTIGERVGYAADANGHRTVIYQVTLKREL